MKKHLIGIIAIAAMALCVGCGNSTDDKPQSKTVEKDGNKIVYVTKGKPVKDDAVFGKNTYVFSPEDNVEDVQTKVKEVFKRQESNQFGDERYALLFKPGEYDKSLEVNVGFYTQAAGLGLIPTDTKIQKLWVDANWMGHNATCNFWRGAENFSANEFCMWATSQAVSLRRMNFNDKVVLSDGEGWSSGGYMADCNVNGTVYSGSQQQYLFRNNTWRFYDNGVWNMVFVGMNKGRIPEGSWPARPYTKVDEAPVVQEKPFLCYDEKEGYGVMVVDRRTNAVGTSWENGVSGTFYSLGGFYIADPEKDNADTINKALSEGKHILLTPGIYEIDKPIEVKNDDTIIFGMGLATLVATEGNVCMETADIGGFKLCGVLFEAGEKESKTLLQVGDKNADKNHADNPICLNDVYFRVGGAKYAGKVQNCVTIECNNVIGDNFWVWRADHSRNVAWDVNTAPNGIIVNGDDVTMYGLFVEHFQEYQTIWNGNGGRLFFYQSELPYDVPNQEAYMSHDGTVKGYASIKIDDAVTNFESYGMGIYCYNRDADIEIFSGVEAPDRDGVALHNTVTVKLNGQGQITHVINDSGYPVMYSGNTGRIVEYENGKKMDY